MGRQKNSKGITLIALIITIVVLLILAVVAIGEVQNDGIITYAKNARDQYGVEQEKENATLGDYLDEIETNLPGNNGGEESNDGGKVTKGVKVVGTNGTYTEIVGNKTLTAIIPVGFCVVKDVEGDSNTIERGLVISDVANDDLLNSKKGNQFVWIPVEDYSKFHLIEGYSNKALDTILGEVKEAGDKDAAGSPMANNNVKGTAESISMYNSVKNNRGFYIARFEAGNPGTTKIDGTVKPLSQKGVDVWNNIPWGGTNASEASDGLTGNDNANGAVKVARSMYTKSNECGVTSTLCYGVQWDAIMNYIDSNYYNGNCSVDSFVVDSTGKGNYYDSDLALTGAYEQNHIFDLAGNVWEWTMEWYHSIFRLYRGGSYQGIGWFTAASARGNACPSDTLEGLRL